MSQFIVEHFGLAMFLLPWLVLAASQFPTYHHKAQRRKRANRLQRQLRQSYLHR